MPRRGFRGMTSPLIAGILLGAGLTLALAYETRGNRETVSRHGVA